MSGAEDLRVSEREEVMEVAREVGEGEGVVGLESAIGFGCGEVEAVHTELGRVGDEGIV